MCTSQRTQSMIARVCLVHYRARQFPRTVHAAQFKYFVGSFREALGDLRSDLSSGLCQRSLNMKRLQPTVLVMLSLLFAASPFGASAQTPPSVADEVSPSVEQAPSAQLPAPPAPPSPAVAPPSHVAPSPVAPPPPAPSLPTPNLPRLEFHAPDGVALHISGGGAAWRRMCLAPCEVSMPPGRYRLAASAGGQRPSGATAPIEISSDIYVDADHSSRQRLRTFGRVWLGVMGPIALGMVFGAIASLKSCDYGCGAQERVLAISAGSLAWVASIGFSTAFVGDRVTVTPRYTVLQ